MRMDNTLRQISDEEIKNLVIDALKLFLENDAADLLKYSLYEVAFSARIAMHIHHLMQCRNFPSNIHVDCEYNRKGKNPKPAPAGYDSGSIRPDIIIHQRGCDENNFLFCEIKKEHDIDIDVTKAEYSLEESLNYRLAAIIHTITSESLKVIWFYPDRKPEEETI